MRSWKEQIADATGPYPVTCMGSDSDVASGLEDLRQANLVSVTLVVDGLTGPSLDRLQSTFSVARPFKTHYLIDASVGDYQPSKHHRYEIRRAARRGVEVRIVPLLEILDVWVAQYEGLISRHDITGTQRFSRESFAALADCEGLTTVAAYIGEDPVSCHLWIQHGDCVRSHLAASNALGYASGAAYAVYDQSIRSFSGRLINLGGAAGACDALDDGLARLKAGFANRTCTAFLVGSILDPKKYQALCDEFGAAGSSEYFPAYRAPPIVGKNSLLANTSDEVGPSGVVA